MSRERLAKLLGMLGSDYDGERATAAAMIAKMAKEAKMGVAEFVMQGGAPQIIYRDRIVEKTVYRDRYNYNTSFTDDDVRPGTRRKPKPPPKEGLIAGLRWAQDFTEHLNGFEQEWIEDILRKCQYDFDLSDKQAKVARRIIAKVKAFEGEPLV